MGEFLAFISACCYSASNTAIKKGVAKIPVLDGVFIGICVNFLFFGVLFLIDIIGSGFPAIDWWTIFLFFLSALGTALFGRLTLYSSIELMGAARASQLSALQPLFTILFAILFLQEVLVLWQYLGIFMILGGVYILTSRAQENKQEKVLAAGSSENIPAAVALTSESKEHRRVFMKGFMLGIASAAFFAGGNVLRKAGLDYNSAVLLGAFIASASSTILYLLYFLLRGGLTDYKRIIGYPLSQLKFYLIDGAFTSVAWLLLFIALTMTTVSSAQALKATIPLTTFFFSFLFLRQEEKLNWLVGLSALIISCGVILLIIY